MIYFGGGEHERRPREARHPAGCHELDTTRTPATCRRPGGCYTTPHAPATETQPHAPLRPCSGRRRRTGRRGRRGAGSSNGGCPAWLSSAVQKQLIRPDQREALQLELVASLVPLSAGRRSRAAAAGVCGGALPVSRSERRRRSRSSLLTPCRLVDSASHLRLVLPSSLNSSYPHCSMNPTPRVSLTRCDVGRRLTPAR